MAVETKGRIEQKLAQARRLLDDVPDNVTADLLTAYIEELETRLLVLTKLGPGAAPSG